MRKDRTSRLRSYRVRYLTGLCIVNLENLQLSFLLSFDIIVRGGK
jgi:hypothetical protein